ncbi:MAG: helix-turn-helix transcriptional regulator, partial [Megasphaera sp.]|nr:helix-turn-helix transcriptional regulator [Megasphaera sp.]
MGDSFAERLRKQRKENHLTQADLAAKIGVSKAAVAMWEKGTRMPDSGRLVRIADLFDKRLDYMMGRTDDESSLTDEDTKPQKWELEDQFVAIIKMYLSLDNFGRSAIENLVRSECLRCHNQQTIKDASDIKISLQI